MSLNNWGAMFNKRREGANMADSILRLPNVKARVGLSRSTIYQRVADGSFPKPVNLGSRAIGWLSAEIDECLAAQIERSRKSA